MKRDDRVFYAGMDYRGCYRFLSLVRAGSEGRRFAAPCPSAVVVSSVSGLVRRAEQRGTLRVVP